jgi:hypothetical protein
MHRVGGLFDVDTLVDMEPDFGPLRPAVEHHRRTAGLFTVHGRHDDAARKIDGLSADPSHCQEEEQEKEGTALNHG